MSKVFILVHITISISYPALPTPGKFKQTDFRTRAQRSGGANHRCKLRAR